MIIVDSVLKQNFFAGREKIVLTINAYLCWILSWAALNNTVAERNLFGLTAYSLPVPGFLLFTLGVVTAASSVFALTVIARRWYACPSSKQMGLLSVFHKGGSGSSLFDVKPLGVDGSSGGFGWSVF